MPFGGQHAAGAIDRAGMAVLRPFGDDAGAEALGEGGGVRIGRYHGDAGEFRHTGQGGQHGGGHGARQ